MWSCPRSRSTAIARAFEQLDDCIVFDEPFFGAYLVKRGLEEPCQEREELNPLLDACMPFDKKLSSYCVTFN